MLGKLNDAYESVKNGLEAQVALATAEQKEKLADAKLSLADLKDFIADLKDENRSLKERLSVKDDICLIVGYIGKRVTLKKISLLSCMLHNGGYCALEEALGWT